MRPVQKDMTEGPVRSDLKRAFYVEDMPLSRQASLRGNTARILLLMKIEIISYKVGQTRVQGSK